MYLHLHLQVFEKHNVRVLGTQIPVIMATEDRDVFAQKLREIDEKLAQSICANTMDEALAAAEKVSSDKGWRFCCCCCCCRDATRMYVVQVSKMEFKWQVLLLLLLRLL